MCSPILLSALQLPIDIRNHPNTIWVSLLYYSELNQSINGSINQSSVIFYLYSSSSLVALVGREYSVNLGKNKFTFECSLNFFPKPKFFPRIQLFFPNQSNCCFLQWQNYLWFVLLQNTWLLWLCRSILLTVIESNLDK